MNSSYRKIAFTVSGEVSDVLIALLADLGFEGFEEKTSTVDAYIESADFDEEALQSRIAMIAHADISYRVSELPRQNWNKQWEENYPSVFIDDFCQIVPSFRQPESGYIHHLIIDPKMSFGTGNHATTRLMIRLMSNYTFLSKKVLDMGCGTGILGILAIKMGANRVLGIDIDEWSKENAKENARLNQAEKIRFKLGDVSAIPGENYDVIFANINRNVLLKDISLYNKHLKPGGHLLLSGFYTADLEKILRVTMVNGLSPVTKLIEKDWVAHSFTKKENKK